MLSIILAILDPISFADPCIKFIAVVSSNILDKFTYIPYSSGLAVITVALNAVSVGVTQSVRVAVAVETVN
jgi:hypothetical protein